MGRKQKTKLQVLQNIDPDAKVIITDEQIDEVAKMFIKLLKGNGTLSTNQPCV